MSDEGRLIAGRYRILDRIGRGGMGTVWRAHDQLLTRQVAVKRLHPQPHLEDDELATRFERARREARSAALISHPNVVVVHDVVDDEGLPAIVMEYVPATTLGDLIEAHGPVPLEEVARIGRGVIAALRAAHRAGILHRDVKPANVLLSEDGRVVLTDFGIARASDSSTLTRTGNLVGSIDFIAPERLMGAKPAPEADLWALGAMLFQAVDGRSPFLRDTLTQTMYAITMEPVPDVRGAGPLTPLIQGLLASNPAERLSAEDAQRLLRMPATEMSSIVTPPAARAAGGDNPTPTPTPAPAAEPAAEPEPRPESGHGTHEAAAAGAAGKGPQPSSTSPQAQRPPARSRKLVVLVAAVATAILISIALLIPTTTEKNSTVSTASNAPIVPNDTTTPQSPGTSVTPSPSSSASSGATSRAASKPSQEDAEPESGGKNASTKSESGTSAAPAGRALTVAASRKCLSSGDGTEGTQLFQAACDGSAAQRWRTGANGTLRSSGKCMTVAGGATDDRTEIQLSGCDGTAGQRFHLAGTELRADQSRKCVDILGGASGTVAVLWECNGRDNQIWTLR
ncbi:serine/threonine protein kinase [Streptomyces sp. NBC_01186]|uniref:serine/threonine protein kinase n=1 Tax=Streptomyces sp. NBC_01186 TaxID=2903765 RepID=UPI002E0DC4EE|nr:serine/threonine protein kinase [Streptomyces sp. NBC_01186]